MPSTRTHARRHPERGVYERERIDAILDEAISCHVGFVNDGQPLVIPMIHARSGDLLYLHGSPASRLLRELGGAIDVCVTATLVDGLVLARSVYKHSLNYRSVVVLGRARKVVEREEKLTALAAIVEHVVPGRSREARPPSDNELAGTEVLAVEIGEASAKVRTGPPKDFDADLALPVWAGVIPLDTVAGEPVSDERGEAGFGVPSYAAGYRRPGWLVGSAVPALTLDSTAGPVDLAELARELFVLFVYPHATGLPRAPVPGWESIPGALGCTAQSCAFRDEHERLRGLGAGLVGLSVQTVDEQRYFAARAGLRYPLVSDPDLRLASALGLPTFSAGGRTFYRRLALVARGGHIVKVFYPVLEPDRNASDVAGWLERSALVAE